MKYPKAVAGAIAVGALAVGVGVGAGVSGGHTTTVVNHTSPPIVKTVRVHVPGPTKTITRTVTVPAPQPTQGQTIATFHGSGNEVTPEFNTPADSNYIVHWTFSNNQFGNGDESGSNFIINTSGSDDDSTGLANAIATSGSGSGEVQDAGSSDSLIVQATGDWTITVQAA